MDLLALGKIGDTKLLVLFVEFSYVHDVVHVIAVIPINDRPRTIVTACKSGYAWQT